MNIFPHQQPAFKELLSRASTYFCADWHDLRIRPRFQTLICGPTGTGKTAIATELASTLGVSLLRVSVNNWMPLGASNRGSRETMLEIACHIANSDKSLIFIDEIDKVWHDSSWKSYIKSELFELLDGRWPAGLKIKEDDDEESSSSSCAFSSSDEKLEGTRKLRFGAFIVAAGTFQDFYECKTADKIGFGNDIANQHETLNSSEIAKRLPRELTNRFHSNLVLLPSLHAHDYQQLAETARATLPGWLHAEFRMAVTRQLPSAVAAQKGCRFVEECVLEALKHAKKPQAQGFHSPDHTNGPCV